MTFSTSFHFPRSWTQVIQFLTLIWQISCLTLSSHLYLSLPCNLLVRGFHLNIFLTVLVSGTLCTWPNQLSFWALIRLNIFLCFISLSNSPLVLILHITASIMRPLLFNNDCEKSPFSTKQNAVWVSKEHSKVSYELGRSCYLIRVGNRNRQQTGRLNT